MKYSKPPLVSVVIITKNEEKYLGKTLESVKNQTYRPIEIVVSDAASTDRTVKIAEKFGARVLVKKSTTAEGRNLGGNFAKGRLLLFMDADTSLQRRWIEHAVDDIENEDADMVLGRFVPFETNFRARTVCWLWSDFLPNLVRLFGVNFHSMPSGYLIKREFFQKVKGFDEDILTGEDAEFADRVSKRGKVIRDKSCISRTSMRRFEKGGYSKWMMYWLVAGGSMILFGKPPMKSYKEIR